MPHDTSIVVEALAKLSRDVDRDVRDWATFALGSQLQSDSSQMRAALHDRVNDIDPEVRGEALVGLARRRDSTIAEAIQRELEGEFHGDWSVEAARHLGDPRFLPALKQLARRLTGKDAVYSFAERCTTRSPRARDAEPKRGDRSIEQRPADADRQIRVVSWNPDGTPS